MCVLVYKPAGIVLDEKSKDDLSRAFDANKEGAGFAWRDGKIHMRKAYFKFEDFWASFTHHVQNQEAVVHFRLASKGKVSRENTHPFFVKDFGIVAHNGTFHGLGNTEISDTREWINTVLVPLLTEIPKALQSKTFLDMLDVYCSYNKLVLLPFKGERIIINEERGAWENDIWYSNKNYRFVSPPNPVIDVRATPVIVTTPAVPVTTPTVISKSDIPVPITTPAIVHPVKEKPVLIGVFQNITKTIDKGSHLCEYCNDLGDFHLCESHFNRMENSARAGGCYANWE